MRSDELVSVVIPTYRRSQRIEKAVRSVINQTYKNIEIVVVDDNADFPEERKRTKQIIKQFPSVKLIQNKKNLGGALTRNVGIKAANGKLIAFLDDDDEMTPARIEKQLKLYLKNKNKNVGIVICNRSMNDLPRRDDMLYRQMMDHLALTSMWLVPKKVLKDVGYFEDSPSEQDAILLLKIIANGYNVLLVPEQLVIMAKHNGEETISGSKPSNIVGLENYRQWCRKYYTILNNKKRINDVEYQLSRRLLTKKLINNLQRDASIELKNMLKRKPFSVNTAKGVLKFLFPSKFIRVRGRNA